MNRLVSRTLKPKLLKLAKQFPALALFGPRQSGKTTLAKQGISVISWENA